MRWDLIQFDMRHGLPLAMKTLGEELGKQRLAALRRFVIRSLSEDPFAPLGPPESDAEEFTRHQLKSMLLFYKVLREDLDFDEDRALAVLGSLAAKNGALFVTITAPHPTKGEWESLDTSERHQLIEEITDRFENMDSEIISLEDDGIGFDVTRCHFVELLTKLDKLNLAPLICAADRMFYDDPLIPIRLDRKETLAGGGKRCAFRLTFEE